MNVHKIVDYKLMNPLWNGSLVMGSGGNKCVMCQHELWPTSVSHPFSVLDSYLGLAGGKPFQKITISILDLFFRSLLFQVAFILYYVNLGWQ